MHRFSKVLLLSFCLWFTCSPLHAQAEPLNHQQHWKQECNQVVHGLTGDDSIAFLGFNPNLKVLHHPLPHASVTKSGDITVTTGMLNLVKNDSEFAFLLAHELGHVVLFHHKQEKSLALMGTSTNPTLLEHEMQADQFALSLLHDSGYDPASGALLLTRLSEFGKEKGVAMSEIYPGLLDRVAAVQSLSSEAHSHKDTAFIPAS